INWSGLYWNRYGQGRTIMEKHAQRPIDKIEQVTTTADIKAMQSRVRDKLPIGFSHEVYAALNSYVTVADAKVVALIGGALTIAALLIAQQSLPWWAFAFNRASAVFLGSAAIIGVIGLYPRMPSSGSSVIFWEDIIRRASPNDYCNDIQKLDP